MFKNVIPYVIIAVLTACAPGKYSLVEENDYFTFFNTDSDYTQGLKFSHQNDEREVGIGQRIYTPVHKKLDVPPSDERPYAGYAYVYYEGRKQVDESTQYLYGIEPGLVGPHAYGDQTQCTFHKQIGIDCPQGWDSQLHDEPTLTLRGAIETKAPVEFMYTRGFVLSRLTAEVGNLSDALIFSSTVQYNLSSWARAYVGPAVHLVARNLLLDGNTFRDSPSVDTNWHYQELIGGFEFRYDNFVVKWILTASSPQFSTQGRSYNYGGVTLTWEQ